MNFATGAACLVALASYVAPACAQDVGRTSSGLPAPMDMRPMGMMYGYDSPIGSDPGDVADSFCKKEAKKQSGKIGCFFVVNKSEYSVVDMRFSIKNGPDGDPIWSENQFSGEFYFRRDHWSSWILPKDWPCVVNFKFTMKVGRRSFGEVTVRDDLCDDTKLPLIVLHNPAVWTVTVEPDASNAPAPPNPKPNVKPPPVPSGVR